MNTQWKVKNIIITNTGKYNKKAGREEEKKKKKEEKEKPQEDHCIQWSTYSLWVCSTLIYLNLARLTRFTAIALQSLFLKPPFCKAPGFSRISAVQKAWPF